MSDTTVGSSPGLVDSVAAYVREVRIELADLPVEDVDDLTGGMEADFPSSPPSPVETSSVGLACQGCMPPSCVPLPGCRRGWTGLVVLAVH